MSFYRQLTKGLAAVFILVLLTACSGSSRNSSNFTSLEIKLLVGSALGDFCNQVIAKFNATQDYQIAQV